VPGYPVRIESGEQDAMVPKPACSRNLESRRPRVKFNLREPHLDPTEYGRRIRQLGESSAAGAARGMNISDQESRAGDNADDQNLNPENLPGRMNFHYSDSKVRVYTEIGSHDGEEISNLPLILTGQPLIYDVRSTVVNYVIVE
jgi:hypothetical protein